MPLATSRLEKGANPLKQYDDEFAYSDEIEPKVAEIVKRVEEGDRVSGTTQTKEEVHRLHEMNTESRKESRFPNQDELKKSRIGRVYHMKEFLRLLRCAGVNAWYPDGITVAHEKIMPGTLGLFVVHEGWKPGICTHAWGEPHYAGYVQAPYMQEYEELFFDSFDVPLGSKRRGWRTVGLRLIEQKLITEQKFHEIFGQPSSGPVSRRYREYLYHIKSKQ